MERDSIEDPTEVQSAAFIQAGQENVAALAHTPGLPSFVDNFNNYLLQFARYATIASCNGIRELLDLVHCLMVKL